jgi:hypothetical protein
LPAARPPRLTAKAATLIIRDRARVTANVILTDHAQEQMVDRGVTAPEVYGILREGAVFDAPVLTEVGEWKAEIEMRMPGGRDVAVVTVMSHANRLVVVTVMWKDLG